MQAIAIAAEYPPPKKLARELVNPTRDPKDIYLGRRSRSERLCITGENVRNVLPISKLREGLNNVPVCLYQICRVDA